MSAIGGRAGEPLADARPRRPRAGDALGAGIAAGDRPRAVRAARWSSSPTTAESTAEIPGLVDDALARGRRGARRGPAFLDFPLDYVFMEAAERGHRGRRRRGRGPREAADAGEALERAAALLAAPSGPVIMAGTDLYWGHGEQALLELGEDAAASRCSSTAWRADACRRTTSCSSPARARRRCSGAPTSRS